MVATADAVLLSVPATAFSFLAVIEVVLEVKRRRAAVHDHDLLASSSPTSLVATVDVVLLAVTTHASSSFWAIAAVVILLLLRLPPLLDNNDYQVSPWMAATVDGALLAMPAACSFLLAMEADSKEIAVFPLPVLG